MANCNHRCTSATDLGFAEMGDTIANLDPWCPIHADGRAIGSVVWAIVAAVAYQLDHEWCPVGDGDGFGHCDHWFDCEPCHFCGYNGGDCGDAPE